MFEKICPVPFRRLSLPETAKTQRNHKVVVLNNLYLYNKISQNFRCAINIDQQLGTYKLQK